MNETQALAYVKAAADVARLPLDDARALRVAMHLQRTAALADALESVSLAPHDEPAELFCPAPYAQSAT